MTDMTDSSPGDRTYDYCLKFLLVGDSDVGKNEILNLLDEEMEVGTLTSTISPKTTVILLEGKRVKLQLWDTSGQGRFGTIIRSYSRGAQGILVVYDITNHWSFEGINRWLKEIDEHAPGVPKILLGNRLHLEFRRRVSRDDAEHFAKKRKMEYFEVSTLALFTICESFTELSRLVLTRNGMERLWKHNKVLPLQELCYRCIAPRLITVHDIDRLPLPTKIKFELKSFAKRDQFTISNTLRRNRPSLMVNSNSPTQNDTIRSTPSRYKRTTSADLFASPASSNDNNNNNIDGHHSSSLVSPFLSKLTNRRRRTRTIALMGEKLDERSSGEIGNNQVDTRLVESESSRSSCVLM